MESTPHLENETEKELQQNEMEIMDQSPHIEQTQESTPHLENETEKEQQNEIGKMDQSPHIEQTQESTPHLENETEKELQQNEMEIMDQSPHIDQTQEITPHLENETKQEQNEIQQMNQRPHIEQTKDNPRLCRELRRLEFGQAGPKAVVKENIEFVYEASKDNSHELSRTSGSSQAAVNEEVIDISDDPGGPDVNVPNLQDFPSVAQENEESSQDDNVQVFANGGNRIIFKRKAGEMDGNLNDSVALNFCGNPKKFKSLDDRDKMMHYTSAQLNKNSNKYLTDEEVAQFLSISLYLVKDNSYWEDMNKRDFATKERILRQIGNWEMVRKFGKPEDIKNWWYQPLVKKFMQLYKRKILSAKVASNLLGVPLAMFWEYNQNILSEDNMIEGILSHKTLPNGSYAYMVLFKRSEGTLSQKAKLVDEKDLIHINRGHIEEYWKKKSKGAINNSSSLLPLDADNDLVEIESKIDQKNISKTPPSTSKRKSVDIDKEKDNDDDGDDDDDDDDDNDDGDDDDDKKKDDSDEDDDDLWQIDRILSHRKRKSKIEYLIAWEGFSIEEATWEPKENLVTCLQLINDYHIQLQSKTRGHNSTDAEPNPEDISNNANRNETKTDDKICNEVGNKTGGNLSAVGHGSSDKSNNAIMKGIISDNKKANDKSTDKLNESAYDCYDNSKMPLTYDAKTDLIEIPTQDIQENYNENPQSARKGKSKDRMTYLKDVDTDSSDDNDNNTHYEVHKILFHRLRKHKMEYLIAWKGYSLEDATWEPEENLVTCYQLVKNYHSQLQQEMEPDEKVTILDDRIQNGKTEYLVKTLKKDPRKNFATWETNLTVTTIPSVHGFSDALEEYLYPKISMELQNQITKEVEYYSKKISEYKSSNISSFTRWLRRNNDGDYTCKYCAEENYPLGKDFYLSFKAIKNNYTKDSSAIFLLRCHAMNWKHKKNSQNYDDDEAIEDEDEQVENGNSGTKEESEISGFMIWAAQFIENFPKTLCKNLVPLMNLIKQEWNKIADRKKQPFHDLANDVNETIQQLKDQLKQSEVQANLLTGYVLYSAEKRREFISKNPAASAKKLAILAFNGWSRLYAKDQKKYQERALCINDICLVSTLKAQGKIQDRDESEMSSEMSTFDHELYFNQLLRSHGLKAKSLQQLVREHSPKCVPNSERCAPKPTSHHQLVQEHSPKCAPNSERCAPKPTSFHQLVKEHSTTANVEMIAAKPTHQPANDPNAVSSLQRRWVEQSLKHAQANHSNSAILTTNQLKPKQSGKYKPNINTIATKPTTTQPVQEQTTKSTVTSDPNETKCICGESGNLDEGMLQCQKCRHWFHEKCVGCLQYKLISGDRFYLYVCELCNNGKEFLHRLYINWNIIVHLALWNLRNSDIYSKYFDCDLKIVPWVLNHWDLLQCPKELQNIPIKERGINILATLKNDLNKFVPSRKKDKWALRVVKPPSVPKIKLPKSTIVNSALMQRIIYYKRAGENVISTVEFSDGRLPQQRPQYETLNIEEGDNEERPDIMELDNEGTHDVVELINEDDSKVYLDHCKSPTTPRQAFHDRSSRTNTIIPPKNFTVGMKLEAEDRKTMRVCVATVADIQDNIVLIHFDGRDKAYDFWTEVSSPHIHPVGYCLENSLVLHPPNDYHNHESFTWQEYLQKTNSVGVPASAFKATSQIYDGNANNDALSESTSSNDVPDISSDISGPSGSSSSNSGGLTSGSSENSIKNSSNTSSSSSSSSSSDDHNTANPDSKTIPKGKLKIETIMAHEGGAESPKSYLVRFCRVGKEVTFGWVKASKMTADQHTRDLLIKYWKNKGITKTFS